ncbi:hypothetical protein IDSA_10925 [Pseudidiomarina salinarum]|uniref:DUF4097 domain-containing protein n=1 Tax=Pseudidiomarina salinarum TaxID=435908 RepID=A0A094JCG7_9GAMM|nr:DUF4097 family beta strand repeat-containing protein [Pseudidiomarina salinarum]KFZ30261.1 hypothetical protein IDSA_10925 [Pseudidiomarina salinarum]RUO69960.1 hypothetical protein CWI79_00355 [Pseudidiomarina salinarum]
MNIQTIKLLGISLTLLPTLVLAQGREIDEQMTISADTRVVIDNMRGKVEVSGWDENQATVTGTLDKHAEDFIFALSGDTLTIKVKMPKRGSYNDNDGSDLTIRLPHGVSLDVKGVSSDFTVSRIDGGTKVRTVSGDLDVRNVTGGVILNSVSGDIFSRELGGSVELKTVSGDIDDADASSDELSYQAVSGDIKGFSKAAKVHAETVSGDLNLNVGTVDNLKVNTVSGDLQTRLELLPRAQVRASSVSGEMNFTFTGTLNAEIDAEANAGGSIHNRLTDDQPQRPRFGPGESISFQLGDGSASVRLTTVSGDIHLRN